MKLYPGGSIGSPEWQAIRERIGKRSGWKCETCRVPNGVIIARGQASDAGTYVLENGHVFDAETGARMGAAGCGEYNHRGWIKIVVTVAHLNHDETDNRDENLAHLCQLHHNRLDAPHRKQNAARTRRTRGGQVDLVDAIEAGDIPARARSTAVNPVTTNPATATNPAVTRPTGERNV